MGNGVAFPLTVELSNDRVVPSSGYTLKETEREQALKNVWLSLQHPWGNHLSVHGQTNG